MSKASSKTSRAFLVNLGISSVVTLLVLLLTQDILTEFPPLRRIENSLIDLRFQRRGAIGDVNDSSRVVIVEISQESFRSLPAPWPWPRCYYTRLIRNLKRAGAKAVGIDLVFSSGDLRNAGEDEEFRKALKETGIVVLAGKLETEQNDFVKREHGENYGNIFIGPGQQIGLVNARTDADGVLRRYMPFAYEPAQERRIPTFSFAVLNVFFNQAPAYTADIYGGYFHYFSRDIPRFDNTSFLVNYYGPSGSFKRVKMADVLDDKDFNTIEEISTGESTNTFDDPDYGYLFDGTFKDKIVLVGSTMPEDKDLFPVSIAKGLQEENNKMYGVEIHANVIQDVLDKNFIVREPAWITGLVVFGLSLFTFVFTAGLKAIKTKMSLAIEALGVAIIAAELFIIFWASVKLFTEKNYLADMTSPIVAILVCYVGSTIYNYVTERKQKALIKTMFSRYVNPTVVDELVAHPEKLRLGGERKELTVFFSDIEKFTTMSEKMPPERLVMLLNEYLTEMTRIVFTSNGTLDKYEGDAIVAFWGAPIAQVDHAFRACRASLDMQAALVEMRKRWMKEKKPLLNVRIGLSTGEMIVGNMGGKDRFDYTVIGDSVNLGARLEGANKQYKTNIMMSEPTYRHVKDLVVARELDLLVVAGKTEPIRVFELLGMRDDNSATPSLAAAEEYSKGLAQYRERNWDEAIRCFEAALRVKPDDYPSQIYIERSELYRAAPPPGDWNGVFIMMTK
jgi:adenylate cyclase